MKGLLTLDLDISHSRINNWTLKLMLNSLAIADAKNVLPHPGGPYNNKP